MINITIVESIVLCSEVCLPKHVSTYEGTEINNRSVIFSVCGDMRYMYHNETYHDNHVNTGILRVEAKCSQCIKSWQKQHIHEMNYVCIYAICVSESLLYIFNVSGNLVLHFTRVLQHIRKCHFLVVTLKQHFTTQAFD